MRSKILHGERALFGARVRALRLGAGFSQEQLADHAGLDRTYVGGVERGERNPSLVNILKLARALNIEPADLFEEWIQ